MFTYSISFVHQHGYRTLLLVHEKDFTHDELDKMVKQTISAMNWGSANSTYGLETDYMCDNFEFKREQRRYYEYNYSI